MRALTDALLCLAAGSKIAHLVESRRVSGTHMANGTWLMQAPSWVMATAKPSMNPTGPVLRSYGGIDQDDVGEIVRIFAGSQK